jgi:hypothetical protein
MTFRLCLSILPPWHLYFIVRFVIVQRAAEEMHVRQLAVQRADVLGEVNLSVHDELRAAQETEVTLRLNGSRLW